MKQNTGRFFLAAVWLGFLSVCPLAPVRGQSVYPAPYAFTTVTNITGLGATGGPDVPACFLHSGGLAVDDHGNIYITDTRRHAICRLTAAGVLTVFAGQPGTAGSTDGAGGAARFYYPQGLALDAAGNLYVADSGNNTIRRVSPAGEVTTLAGMAGQVGSVDGTGNGARFNYPNAVALDSQANIYVADLYNFTVRKLTPDGVVTTLAGLAENDGSVDGRGSAARFRGPFGIAVGNGGDIYVLDIFDGVRKVTPSGQVTTVAGKATYEVGSADGIGGAAQFNHPSALVVDKAENIYLTDTANNTIRRIAPDGTAVTLAGQAMQAGSADGVGNLARFCHPMGIALDRDGCLYVGDLGNGRLRKGFSGKLAKSRLPVKSAGSLSFATP